MLRNAKGVVRCLVFQSQPGFPSDGARARGRVVRKSVDGAAVCAFDDPRQPTGMLAIAFIHDENGNQEPDRNSFGCSPHFADATRVSPACIKRFRAQTPSRLPLTLAHT